MNPHNGTLLEYWNVEYLNPYDNNPFSLIEREFEIIQKHGVRGVVQT